MNILQATKNCFSRSLDFKGRSRRSEFWGFFLFLLLMNFVLGYLDSLVFDAKPPISVRGAMFHINFGFKVSFWTEPISTLFSLLIALPLTTAAIRRLHDMGRRGFFLVLPILVPNIIMLFFSRNLLELTSSQLMTLLLATFSAVIYILYLLFKDSDYANKYGPSEKYPNGPALNPLKDAE